MNDVIVKNVRELEPDLIVDGDKTVYMSDAEKKRFSVRGWAEVLMFLSRRGVFGRR